MNYNSAVQFYQYVFFQDSELGCMTPGPLGGPALLVVGVEGGSFSLCAQGRCTFPEEWNR